MRHGRQRPSCYSAPASPRTLTPIQLATGQHSVARITTTGLTMETQEEVRDELAALRQRVNVLEEFSAVAAETLGAAAKNAGATLGLQQQLTDIVRQIVAELFDVPGDDATAGATLEDRIEVLEGVLIAMTGNAKHVARYHEDLQDSRDGVVMEAYQYNRPAAATEDVEPVLSVGGVERIKAMLTPEAFAEFQREALGHGSPPASDLSGCSGAP